MTLEQRLARLERQNRYLKMSVLAVALVVMVGFLGASSYNVHADDKNPTFDTVTVTKKITVGDLKSSVLIQVDDKSALVQLEFGNPAVSNKWTTTQLWALEKSGGYDHIVNDGKLGPYCNLGTTEHHDGTELNLVASSMPDSPRINLTSTPANHQMLFFHRSMAGGQQKQGTIKLGTSEAGDPYLRILEPCTCPGTVELAARGKLPQIRIGPELEAVSPPSIKPYEPKPIK